MWWRPLRALQWGQALRQAQDRPFDCAVPELVEGQDRPRHHINAYPPILALETIS
jgi:hypothetical protein